ncbi:hypothetical protein BDF20DRAFT_798183, partial [Mycotypha africana]|uniref:uncharacterized protein n=1 Tax=Mycotypha africana TaxID=64632 RepID=UPI002301AB9D
SMLIQHAESLEWITADLLRTENKVRELKSLERSISEGYDYREKFYLDRLTEYEQILKLQTSMIDDLSELEQRNIEASYFHQCRDNCKGSTKSSSNNSTHNGSYFPSTNFEDKQQLSSMNDIAHKIRWKTAKWIGGSVSTCQVVYSFNRPRDVPEFIIAGSVYITPPTTLSNSLQRYHYLLHINAHDQNTLFRLLPKRYWIPDADSLTCQFQSCTTSFSFFQRRHHCRRCGILVCQEHSLNRLPLFSPQEQHHLSWYRVCDTCFFDLIIARS